MTDSTNRFISLCILTALIFLTAASSVVASVFQHQDQLHISNLHRIEDDFYAFSNDMTVDGFIDGDLSVFTYSFQLNGQVTGSANIFAYELDHRGQIDRTLRVFANTMDIDGTVGHSVLLMGGNVTLGRSAVVGRDARIYGENVRISGNIIGGDCHAAGKTVTIEGTIAGNLYLHASKATIASTAVVQGDIEYESTEQEALTVEDGATVAGEIVWNEPETAADGEGGEFFGAFSDTVMAISKWLAAFLFGIIIVLVFRRHAEESYRQLRSRLVVSFAVGVLSLLVFAFTIILLSITTALLVIGLLLISGEGAVVGALVLVFSILMFPITTFATVCGGIIFYAGKIVLGFYIGALILGRAKSDRALNGWNLLLGLGLLTLVFNIPFVGFAIYLLVSITGAGAIVLGVRHCKRPGNGTAPTFGRGGQTQEPPPVQPPPETT